MFIFAGKSPGQKTTAEFSKRCISLVRQPNEEVVILRSSQVETVLIY